MSVVEDFDCPDAGGGGLYFNFMRCLRCLKGEWDSSGRGWDLRRSTRHSPEATLPPTEQRARSNKPFCNSKINSLTLSTRLQNIRNQ